MRLNDKIAVITGGGTGIGRGIALAYAREGAKIVIAGRTSKTGESAVKEIKGLGGEAIYVQTDISSIADNERLVSRAIGQYQRIDILVNNAGISTSFTPFLEMEEEDFDKVLDVNLKGTYFLTQRVAREMAKQKKGKIIIIISNLAMIAQEGLSHYASSKGGLRALTHSLALELAECNIQVNAIAPGEIRVETAEDYYNDPANKPKFDAIPSRRVGTPEDVAGAAIFLGSEESNYITGTTIVIDGGQMIA